MKEYLEFSEAITQVMLHKSIRRAEWDYGVTCYLEGGVLMIEINGQSHQWIIHESDLLATDWEVVKKEEPIDIQAHELNVANENTEG